MNISCYVYLLSFVYYSVYYWTTDWVVPAICLKLWNKYGANVTNNCRTSLLCFTRHGGRYISSISIRAQTVEEGSWVDDITGVVVPCTNEMDIEEATCEEELEEQNMVIRSWDLDLFRRLGGG